jgi:hypothetical protein
MNNSLDELRIIAAQAYIGWLKGDDVVTPMNRLKKELESQGVNIDLMSRIYDDMKRN